MALNSAVLPPDLNLERPDAFMLDLVQFTLNQVTNSLKMLFMNSPVNPTLKKKHFTQFPSQ